MDHLFLQGEGGIGVGRYLAVPDQDRVRVVELVEQGLPSPDIQHGEGGVGQMPDAADRKRVGHGSHRVVNGKLFDNHMAEHPGGQSGENVGFDAASQAVGQHQYMILLIFGDVKEIAADTFPFFIEAYPAEIRHQSVEGDVQPVIFVLIHRNPHPL